MNPRSLPFFPFLRAVYRQWPCIFPRNRVMSVAEWSEETAKAMGWYARRRAPWSIIVNDGDRCILPVASPSIPPQVGDPEGPSIVQDLSWTIPPAALHYVGEAYVFSRNGIVLSDRNELFDELSHGWANDQRWTRPHNRPFETFAAKIDKLDGPAAVLAVPGYDSHYHFLLQMLPRLSLLGEHLPHIRHFLVPDDLTVGQIAWLELFGVAKERLFPVGRRQKVWCRQLFAPSIPTVEGATSSWVVERLREAGKCAASNTNSRPTRVYLGRGRGMRRGVKNEEVVERILSEKGFTIYDGADLSPAEQISAMANATIIVGPHGAALTNMVFASNAVVLEIVNPATVSMACYYPLALRCGHRYFWMEGESLGSGPLDGIKVPVERLIAALEIVEKIACS